MVIAALLALAAPPAAAAPAPSSAVLVARAVGGDAWRIESRAGATTLRNIRLAEGQKIILIDGRGTREIAGPGELLLLSKGVAAEKPLFAIAFRALIAPRGAKLQAGVRGAGDNAAAAKPGWEQLTPR